MNIKNNYIKTLQDLALDLMESSIHKPRWMISKWNCSEVTRILGLQILKDLGIKAKPTILIGKVTKIGLTKENKHDILMFFDDKSQKYVLIDPTVWQFFRFKKSILLGKFDSIKDVLTFAQKTYGGKWKISEPVTKKDSKMITKWKKIIKLNADQAPNWD
jgi:hypothetical protein